MYCPKCGLEHVEARRFCNRCGTNLDLVTRALNGAFTGPSERDLKRGRRRILARGFWFFSIGGVFGLTCLVIREILGALGVHQAWFLERVALFGPLSMLLAVLWTIYQLIAFGTHEAEPSRPAPPLSTVLPVPDKLSAPAANTPFRTPASVTETATHSLDSRGNRVAGIQGEGDTAEGRRPGAHPSRIKE